MNHISIIIPVYNVEKYLPDCIENVAQKSKYNIEIILIDDGSSDGSGQLCDDYALKFDNVKVLHKENGGLGSARNAGLQVASGEYILFLDSDDYITVGALEDLYDRASGKKLDILLFGASTFFEDEKSSKNIPKQNYARKCCLGRECTGLELLCEEQRRGQYITSVCLRLYRLEYLQKENRRFNEEIIHEDIDYSFFTLLNAEKVEAYEKNYYQRRYRPGSIITSSKLQKKFAGYEYVWYEFYEYAKNATHSKKRQAVIRHSEFCLHNIFYIISQMEAKESKCIAKRYKKIFRMAKEYTSSYARKTKLSLCFPGLCVLFLKTQKPLRNILKIRRLIMSEPFWYIKLLNIIFTKRRKRIFLFGTPIHGNAGDHLIALAEKQFIKEAFQEYKFIEFTMPFSSFFSNFIRKNIKDKDLIFISGGGWLGTDWPHNEIYVRDKIKEFKDNLVVILPQTVHYTFFNTFFEEGKMVYRNHKNLLFCLREDKSFDFVNNNFADDSKTLLLPDFAMLYKNKKINDAKQTDTVKLCFRQDIEKILSQDELTRIKELIVDRFGSYKEFDTVKYKMIPLYKRRKYVEQTLKEVSEAKLVVTDRLHAMIMCALTGTACIAYDNSTHKVYNVYKWIKSLNYIQVLQEGDDFAEVVETVLKTSREMNNCQYNDLQLRNYYKSLESLIIRQKGQE